MYIAPGQGQTAPRGQNFDVNRKALSLYPFVASFNEISLKSDFIQFFSWFNTCIYPRGIHCFTFFPYKSIRDQIWPCRKIGQHRVIIWINLVVLEHPILHTKFQGHRPFGSGEDDFLRFLPYMGMVAILVMWPGPFEQNFVPPFHGHSIWNLASIIDDNSFWKIHCFTFFPYKSIRD